MPTVDIPTIVFSEWQRWRARSRPSQEFDVPADFGILGLYVLAAADSTLVEQPAEERYLQASVLYIGMSTHVEQRLASTHKAVSTYRTEFNDQECSKLWFASWHSDWNNRELRKPHGAVALATIALYERFLLLSYARKHGRLPHLNRM